MSAAGGCILRQLPVRRVYPTGRDLQGNIGGDMGTLQVADKEGERQLVAVAIDAHWLCGAVVMVGD